MVSTDQVIFMLTKNGRDVKGLNLKLLEPETRDEPTSGAGNNSPTGSGGNNNNNNNNSPTGIRSSFPTNSTQSDKLKILRSKFSGKELKLADWQGFNNEDQLALFGALCGTNIDAVANCAREAYPREQAGLVFCMMFNFQPAPAPLPQQPPGPNTKKQQRPASPTFPLRTCSFGTRRSRLHYALPSAVKLKGNYRDDYCHARAILCQLSVGGLRHSARESENGSRQDDAIAEPGGPVTILDTELNRTTLKQGKEHAKFTDKFMNKDKKKKKGQWKGANAIETRESRRMASIAITARRERTTRTIASRSIRRRDTKNLARPPDRVSGEAPGVTPAPETGHNLGVEMNVPIFPSPPKKSKISEERILVGEELTTLLAKEMAIMELEGNPIGSLKRHLSAWEAEGCAPQVIQWIQDGTPLFFERAPASGGGRWNYVPVAAMKFANEEITRLLVVKAIEEDDGLGEGYTFPVGAVPKAHEKNKWRLVKDLTDRCHWPGTICRRSGAPDRTWLTTEPEDVHVKLLLKRGRRIGDRRVGRVSGLNTRERNIAQSTRYEVRDSEPIPTLGSQDCRPGPREAWRGVRRASNARPFVGAKRARVARCSGQKSTPSRQRWNPVDPVK